MKNVHIEWFSLEKNCKKLNEIKLDYNTNYIIENYNENTDNRYFNKNIKFLRELYPHLKEDDLRLLAELNDKDDLKAYAKGMGWEDKDIKKDL